MRYWDFEQEYDVAVAVGLQVIGGIVREARLRRHLTQRQLAWQSTLSQSTISRLETGRLRGMRLHTLAAIIGVLRTGSARGTVALPARGPSRRRLPHQDELASVAE